MPSHPKDRPAEPADPFQMLAGGVEGDPLLMLDCVVEEYARMGLEADEIVALFEDPQFLATHGLRSLFGVEATRERVLSVLSRCGILRVTASAAPPTAPFPCKRS
ncbi:MAG: hypothetical protein GY711_00130 [bacterium]|nr:hypothetical protein [bacterium]